MDNCIGIDIGYGFTKTFNSEGAKIFPTVVTRVVPISTFSEIKIAIIGIRLTTTAVTTPLLEDNKITKKIQHKLF